MPIYAFQCPLCGKNVECLRKMGDDHPPICDCVPGNRGPFVMKPLISRSSFKLNFGPLAGVPDEQHALMHGRERV